MWPTERPPQAVVQGAAAGCALGAALAEMAARFAGREEEAARAAALRSEALRLGEADLTAYPSLLEAQRLPADDPERAERVAAAVSVAAEVPLAIAEAAAGRSRSSRGGWRETGNRHLVGDALAGADIAAGSCRAAARLVELNLGRRGRRPARCAGAGGGGAGGGGGGGRGDGPRPVGVGVDGDKRAADSGLVSTAALRRGSVCGGGFPRCVALRRLAPGVERR